MLMSDDVTIEILKSIRDEIRGTNRRIDATNERLESTNERLDHFEQSTNTRLDRLEKRQVETEIRLATEIVAVAGAVNKLTEAFKETQQVRATVRNHEKRLTALEKRVRR